MEIVAPPSQFITLQAFNARKETISKYLLRKNAYDKCQNNIINFPYFFTLIGCGQSRLFTLRYFDIDSK